MKFAASCTWTRREVVAACAATLGISGRSMAFEQEAIQFLPTTQVAPDGFFRLAKFDRKTLLVAPDGRPFFSIGLNHIDPATLRYVEHGNIWKTKYNNSMQLWLKTSVRPDLLDWGFNSVGNTAETASSGPTNHRQTRRFTYDEYQALDLPYCHQLDFADFHHWDAQHRLPDFFASEFEDWCDYVAREYCATLSDDPNLIGYFYMDCPGWVHTHPHSRWRGAMFDYRKLETEAGRKELFDLATRYYKVTHDAVRRYDPHHLILGDRYEGRGRMAREVLLAAKPFVDVLSFQHFGTPTRIQQDLSRWAAEVERPTLLADSGGKQVLPDGSQRHDVTVYRDIMKVATELPDCIGFHLCGAYLKNRVRRKGLRAADETPDEEVITGIRQVNQEARSWLDSASPQLRSESAETAR